jgi:hypothetical protein
MTREVAVKRFWILAGAAAVTLGSLTLALILGSAGFDFRRYTQHQRRLQKVMREQPTVDLLTRAFQEEGTTLLAAPATPEEKERAIAGHGRQKTAEIREKSARHAQTRVYQTADMLYFVYFDEKGVMRDFTCVSR